MKEITPNLFIKRMAKQIGNKFRPRQIILFGSHALGKADQNSDIDILVIFSKEGNLKKRYVDISKEIGYRPFPIDLLVKSSKQIKKRIHLGDSFIEEILTQGKVIYES